MLHLPARKNTEWAENPNLQFSHMTSRLIWYRLNVPTFYKWKSKWLWPFKVTWGQIKWCNWLSHIWFPVCNSNVWLKTRLLYETQAFKIWVPLNLTFKVTQGQILLCSLTPPCMISYQCLVITYDLTRLLYEIQAFPIWVILNLTFKVTQGQTLWCGWAPHMWFPFSVK